MIIVKNLADNSTFIKAKIRTSGPISTQQIEGVNMWNVETVTSLILCCSKITMKGACYHQIKCHLLLDVESVKNLDITLTRRHITLLNSQ